MGMRFVREDFFARYQSSQTHLLIFICELIPRSERLDDDDDDTT